MASRLHDGDYVEVIDHHIEELEERISALRKRMAAMTLERYEIRNQEVLLATMLETRKDLETFRAELVQA